MERVGILINIVSVIHRMPICPYGNKCYRKNMEHISEYHPEKRTGKENEKESDKKGKITEFMQPKVQQRKRKANTPEKTKDVKKRDGGKGRKNGIEKVSSPSTSATVSSTSATVPSPSDQPFPIPKVLIQFYDHARKISGNNPLTAFSSLRSLRLVGPFEYLSSSGVSNLSSDDQLLHWRHANDLPEMQTIAVYEGGRFVLWRDEPTVSDCLIVHVEGNGREHFPLLEVIGDHPAYMMVKMNADPKFFPDNMEMSAMKDHAKKVIAKRKKESLGSPLHGPNGPRICVKVVNDVGYRPIHENATKLKKTLSLIGSTDDEELKEKKMEGIREIVTFVQFANDEMDFGMGLEMGHNLFLSNYPCFDRMTKIVLMGSYNLLGREKFADIIRLQFEDGNRRRDNYSKLDT